MTVAELFTEELFYFTKLTSDTELDVYNASIESEKAVKQKRIPCEYQPWSLYANEWDNWHCRDP
mgnify:CR=1 FL=1